MLRVLCSFVALNKLCFLVLPSVGVYFCRSRKKLCAWLSNVSLGNIKGGKSPSWSAEAPQTIHVPTQQDKRKGKVVKYNRYS